MVRLNALLLCGWLRRVRLNALLLCGCLCRVRSNALQLCRCLRSVKTPGMAGGGLREPLRSFRSCACSIFFSPCPLQRKANLGRKWRALQDRTQTFGHSSAKFASYVQPPHNFVTLYKGGLVRVWTSQRRFGAASRSTLTASLPIADERRYFHPRLMRHCLLDAAPSRLVEC